jgi:hypothetical protein
MGWKMCDPSQLSAIRCHSSVPKRIPGVPVPDENPHIEKKQVAAAVAQPFLTSIDSIGFQSEVSPAARGSGDRETEVNERYRDFATMSVSDVSLRAISGDLHETIIWYSRRSAVVHVGSFSVSDSSAVFAH